MQLRNKILFTASLLSFTAFSQTQATPPQLDELSDTKLKLVLKSMEAAQLQQSIAAKNVQDARDGMQQLVIALEAKYPGFTLNMQSGALIAKPTTTADVNKTKKDTNVNPTAPGPKVSEPVKK